jgi:uncharacterized protein YukE
MDPLSAFSLFCNIITTADAAIKISKNLKDLYTSTSGFSKESQRIRDETTALAALLKEISSSQAQLSGVPQHPRVDKVAEECSEVCKGIQSILEKCKVDAHGSKTFAVIKAWATSQSTKSELQEMQTKLQERRGRLQEAMAIATQYACGIPYSTVTASQS